jgi:hypothetical protein
VLLVETKEDRGDVVPLEKAYHSLIMERLAPGGKRPTYDDLAKLLSVGRGTAERLVKFDRVTDDTLRAACKQAGLKYPILSATCPEEIDWFEVIRFLRTHRPEFLEQQMDRFVRLRDAVQREIDITAEATTDE